MPHNSKSGDGARARHDCLCNPCRGVSIERLASPGGYAHHSTLKEWINSADSCRLCSLFWQEFCSLSEQNYKSIRPGRLSHLKRAIKDEIFQASHRLEIQWDQAAGMCSLLATSTATTHDPGVQLSEIKNPFTHIELFTDENDPATDYGVPWRRILPQNTSCEASISVARLWMSQCLESHRGMQVDGNGFTDQVHAACDRNATSEPYAAAQLLEISATHVRAVPAAGVKQPYATLSYSWGEGLQWPWGPQRIQRHDLSAIVETGLSREFLPKTIREAVWVSEKLGLRHLWVDALCVKQDGVDFITESVKMAAIYSQALINISANHSPSNNAGLFNTRSRSQHHHFPACIAVDSLVSERPSRLCFYQRSDRNYQPKIPGLSKFMDLGHDAYRKEVDQGRLAQRAWVLQERISSPRVLHFGATQLFWQCNRVTNTEDNLGTLESRERTWDSMDTWKMLFFPSELTDLVTESSPTIEDVAKDWRLQMAWTWSHDLIPQYYSQRQLTNCSDKLLAIAGLARQIWQQQPRLRYFAGLWSESMADSLLWYAPTPGRRIVPYAAPSWSWASIQGKVGCADDMLIGDDAAFHCEIINCQVTTLDGDQFGPVTGGTLEIEAAALQGLVSPGKHRVGTLAALELNTIDVAYHSYAMLDEERTDTIRLHALLLKEKGVNSLHAAEQGWDLLLIAPKDDTSTTFVRFGYGNLTLPKTASLSKSARSRWILE